MISLHGTIDTTSPVGVIDFLLAVLIGWGLLVWLLSGVLWLAGLINELLWRYCVCVPTERKTRVPSFIRRLAALLVT